MQPHDLLAPDFRRQADVMRAQLRDQVRIEQERSRWRTTFAVGIAIGVIGSVILMLV